MAALIDTRLEYRHLETIYLTIAAAVFLIVVLAVAFAVLRFRRRPPERAARWHEHNLLEGAYAVALVLVAAFLLVLTFHAESRVDNASATERPALTIDVTASRWVWSFSYRGHRLTERSGYDAGRLLTVPTDAPVRFNLRSTDVIHSFWIPQLAFKRDAFPGTTETITLDFDHAGSFSGACAEYCGLHHSEMVFGVHAVPAARFDSWLARAGGGAGTDGAGAGTDGAGAGTDGAGAGAGAGAGT